MDSLPLVNLKWVTSGLPVYRSNNPLVLLPAFIWVQVDQADFRKAPFVERHFFLAEDKNLI